MFNGEWTWGRATKLVGQGGLAPRQPLTDAKRGGQELDGALVDIQLLVTEHAALIGIDAPEVLGQISGEPDQGACPRCTRAR